MRRIISLLLVLAAILPLFAYRYQYKTVENDPLKTLEYTLPNGLKMLMTVNRDEPRIQANIAVRVGGKNDPAETTGLAHYFEHLMFKGTKQFGTSDFAREEPLLNQIESLFELYRQTTDSLERARIYAQIDSVSYLASTIAIPNEYDKLMAAIGANGTNAYTSYDVTCYVENIPSNQVQNWAMIQADRFKNPILRGFHTELETIYEEKNMSLTNDGRKVVEKILQTLFPQHPYGTQTVLGTQQHLKNPSITNVKNYHSKWYVPNNMAVVLAGDFDPDQMVDLVTEYFGDMQPNTNLPAPLDAGPLPLSAPVITEVKGPNAEVLYMAWRTPSAADPESVVLAVLTEVLSNGQTGLFDLNIDLPQRAQGSGAFVYDMADGGALFTVASPKEGQSLDQLREMLLDEMANLRAGNFSDDLIPAIVNNRKLKLQRQFESNGSAASLLVDAFVNRQSVDDLVNSLAALDKVTKADVVALANKYFGPENYVAVNKLQGVDDSIEKIGKPKLTPIATNRDMASDFLKSVQTSQVEPIQPVFLDFKTDITYGRTKKSDIEVLYTQNRTNDIFELTFVYDLGTLADRNLGYANAYLDLLGTPDMTAEQVKAAFYALACNYNVSAGTERTYVVISGLSENMEKALALYEKLLAEAQPDAEVWAALSDRYLKSFNDSKLNQQANFSSLRKYMQYGPGYAKRSAYHPAQLKDIDSQEILKSLRSLNNYNQTIIYYGPQSLNQVIATLDKTHATPAKLLPVPAFEPLEQAKPAETLVFLAPYDAKQLYMSMFANRGKTYDADIEPMRRIYNEYFGGGMNSIVFQEMRESRSLAYSAGAIMLAPDNLVRPYVYQTQIATQNDKMGDAIEAFDLIINNMPESQAAFNLAKDGLDSRLRTERIIKDDIAWELIRARKLGIDYDRRRPLFDALPAASLADVITYQNNNVKDNIYYYAILADLNDIDMDKLKALGRVITLTTDEIFGF